MPLAVPDMIGRRRWGETFMSGGIGEKIYIHALKFGLSHVDCNRPKSMNSTACTPSGEPTRTGDVQNTTEHVSFQILSSLSASALV